jgi:hypothetical protein
MNPKSIVSAAIATEIKQSPKKNPHHAQDEPLQNFPLVINVYDNRYYRAVYPYIPVY